MEKSVREQCAKRWEALKSERSSWMDHWEQISRVLLPRAGRFLVTDNNRGDKRHNKILDNTGTRALRTLSGGMMAGMTSPARPWFRLTTRDARLDETYEVKQWTSRVTALMQMIFNRSNVYRALQSAYEELGAFGTTATIMLDDFDSVIHCMPLTIGEFAIATGSRSQINTLYREFRMTVAALVEEFGYENVCRSTQQLYDKGRLDDWVTVINAIEPRKVRDPHRKNALNMPYRSVYFEANGRRDSLLRESGYRHFPVLAARWSVTGGDIYGTSPGMEALGDLRQLQQEQLYKGKAIAYQADPPVIVPADLRNQEDNLVPGGVVYLDTPSQAQGVRSSYEVPLQLQYLLADIQDVRDRVDQAFYKDIFMMIAGSQNDRMTATEVAERHEEKMLMLGPVLERLNAELLDPLITMTFDRMVLSDLLPPIPDALQGVELNVDFVSILAQAQRAISTNAIDRFTQNLGQLVAIKPELVDKFDADYWADYYADALGIDPQLIVPNSRVAVIRQSRAQQQQQAEQLAAAQQLSEVAKNVGSMGEMRSASPDQIMGQFAGY